jgi:hypothetical protein
VRSALIRAIRSQYYTNAKVHGYPVPKLEVVWHDETHALIQIKQSDDEGPIYRPWVISTWKGRRRKHVTMNTPENVMSGKSRLIPKDKVPQHLKTLVFFMGIQCESQ